MKDLTLKTLSLIALTSSDRSQTIHAMKVTNYVDNENNITFVIFDRLKHTRRVLKRKEVICVSCDITIVNVMDYAKIYIDGTEPFQAILRREGHDRLISCFSPGLMKTCHSPYFNQIAEDGAALNQGGINTYQFLFILGCRSLSSLYMTLRRDTFQQYCATFCIRRLDRVYQIKFSCDFYWFVLNEFVFSDSATIFAPSFLKCRNSKFA